MGAGIKTSISAAPCSYSAMNRSRETRETQRERERPRRVRKRQRTHMGVGGQEEDDPSGAYRRAQMLSASEDIRHVPQLTLVISPAYIIPTA